MNSKYIMPLLLIMAFNYNISFAEATDSPKPRPRIWACVNICVTHSSDQFGTDKFVHEYTEYGATREVAYLRAEMRCERDFQSFGGVGTEYNSSSGIECYQE